MIRIVVEEIVNLQADLQGRTDSKTGASGHQEGELIANLQLGEPIPQGGAPSRQEEVHDHRGAYSVTAETPRRTRRGHSPAPRFPSTYNFHVSTELAHRHKISHRKGDMGSTWHCDIPDVTVPKKPDFKGLEEDLGDALTSLFRTKAPDTPEAIEPPAAPPAQPCTGIKIL